MKVKWMGILTDWISMGHDVRVYYGAVTDALYVYIGEPQPYHTVEIDEGVFLQKSLATGKECGMIVYDYKKQEVSHDV